MEYTDEILTVVRVNTPNEADFKLIDDIIHTAFFVVRESTIRQNKPDRNGKLQLGSHKFYNVEIRRDDE